ncbi:peptidoglycan editing factor PgeF [[Phormidium] sp. LEGE 05292]|uniref:peptidoglycan editing factor PgeF n=1 Tax=[Phormidium] sp. LEGE 05292 TaxID=767427 RepID=UPI002AD42083|nr:peptidoglycan editing factor PgeF [Phormidium sp. LEGE 05292]
MISPQTSELELNNSANSAHSWQWRFWEGLPYLTCSLLANWQHGFFTRQFSPRFPVDLVQVLHSDAEFYRVRQVHGSGVLTPAEVSEFLGREKDPGMSEFESLPPADALVTEREKQAVWVCTADCTPVLIADETTRQVAAIHAGWRGTAKRIVPEAIARLVSQGSKLENLRIAMGPAITGEVYQVSQEVAAEVGATVVFADSETEILTALQELPNSPIFPDSEPGKVRLDVRRVNELQLKQMGVAEEQIAISPHCTYQQPDYFFSYRRDQLKKVQWSGIVSQ